MSENLDTESLNELFEIYREIMFKTAKSILCNDINAEDAVQEAFLHIINNPDKFSRIPIDKRGGYLNRVVANACYDFIRSENRRHECNIDSLDICSGSSSDDEVLSALTVEEIRDLLNELLLFDKQNTKNKKSRKNPQKIR